MLQHRYSVACRVGPWLCALPRSEDRTTTSTSPERHDMWRADPPWRKGVSLAR